MKILIVEDEEDLSSMLKFLLEKEFDAEVECVSDGNEAEKRIRANAYDLIILDVMLPGVKGITLCKIARETLPNADTPIIIITAVATELEERLKGFECGADDYIIKPFNHKEFIARIQAVLRRSGKISKDVLKFMGIVLDKRSKSVTVDGKPVHLTKTELELLEFFLEHPEQLFSKEELLELIWKGEHDETTRTVDVYISRLRKKLGEKGKYLKTLPRLGYKLTKNPET
jgi:DNA-binding response OmpR family regulator